MSAAESGRPGYRPDLSEVNVESRAFVRLRRPSYFLFAWPKRKITKEKGHPAWRLPGILPAKSVSRGRAFRQDSCPVEKASTSLSMPAARPVVPDSPPHRGPGRAAGHRGPHYSEEPDQEPLTPTLSPAKPGRGSQDASCVTATRCFVFLAPCSLLSQPRCGCVPSAGHDDPLLYPGPLCSGGRAEESPQGGSHGCEPVWRQGRMPCRQTP